MSTYQNKTLELININKAFGDTYAIHDVSLTVQEAEFVSIIGPSGCGKSTLLNMISGLIDPDEGEILINGVDYDDRKGLVSYMVQKDLLLPWLKIIDNVVLSKRLAGVSKQEARETARPLFKIFGLEGFENKYPFQLSGGMRQRAALMRTYIDGKEVMLLDEPFAGLDALTKVKMQDWLLKIKGEINATILFVTHDIEEAIYLSDRVYIMSDRPSEIKEEKVIHLDRPRNRDMMMTEEFNSIKQYLLKQF
jgi:ABC-type nitrate/sulfonate/bicarbonate transport system ATPase subunit